MNKILATIVSLVIYTAVAGQNCNCETTFNQLKQQVEDNYAGWFDKVNKNNRPGYDNWTSNYSAQSKKIRTDSACYINAREWISFFKDKHLTIRYIEPEKSSKPTVNDNAPIKIATTTLTEKQIKDYLTKSKQLDKVEGIYESSSYQLGITKFKQNIFYATIITTSNDNWKPGEVKLIIEKKGTQYTGTFFEGDKSAKTEHTIKVVDNILDFDIQFYEKKFPVPKIQRNIKEYEIVKDKQAPKLTFTKKSLAVFTFPNFYGDSYEQLDYLLKKNEDKLKITPYWIIDLRDNDGGNYQVGMQLIKYIYTQPIIRYNAEMRMSESNYTMWYNNFAKEAYENADSISKKEFETVFANMKSNYGKMYNRSGKPTDTIVYANRTNNPKKIGLIINHNTVSSGELFTLIARQSDKVAVFGTNSGGMMDYGNVVTYKTTCPSIWLRLPMNRQLWLDRSYSVDKEGIKPDVYLKEGNWIEKTYKALLQ
jgi:C-terminal processing protease CtpA/Prc